MYPNSMLDIMILAQVVIQIFCWQGFIGLQIVFQKREIIQPNIHRISQNINQVIYTLDTILVSNIMILAQSGSSDILLTMSFKG